MSYAHQEYLNIGHSQSPTHKTDSLKAGFKRLESVLSIVRAWGYKYRLCKRQRL